MQVKAHRLEELELLLTLLSLLLAFLAPHISQRGFHFLLGRLRLARRPRLALLLVAGLPLILRFALLPRIPVPQPQVQEEFSYLLGADTFAHGRLANPPHPMGVFFDNIQQIQTPHYASARLPGQAAFLCIGEVVFHLPWLGVVLSVGLMCAAFYWMLRAWTRPSWALLAALLFGIRFGVFTYWMNSYWGGAVTALGGALVLGALPRILGGRRIWNHSLRNALLYALGCCLLASTRPYEGLAYVLPTAIVLIAWWLGPTASRGVRFVRVLLPIVCVLAAFLLWFAYYNFAATGNPLETAYGVWRGQQGMVPSFWWEHLRQAAPTYYSPQTRQFNTVWEVGIYRDLHRSFFAGISTMAWRLVQFLQLYLRPLLLLPLLLAGTGSGAWDTGVAGKAAKRALLWNGLWFLSGLLAILLGHAFWVSVIFLGWGAFRLLQWRLGSEGSRRGGFYPARIRPARLALGMGIPVVLLLVGALCAVLTNFSMPTYYAHFTAPAFVLVAVGLRSLAVWRRRQGIGRAIVVNLSLSCCLMFLVSAAFSVLHVHVVHESPFNWTTYENILGDRAAVESFLGRRPGEQLAIVRYGPHHDVLDDWVWNLADIDRQKVVWAHELKPAWNAQLLRYYSGRKVWLVEPDSGSILPYPVASLPLPAEPVPLEHYGK